MIATTKTSPLLRLLVLAIAAAAVGARAPEGHYSSVEKLSAGAALLEDGPKPASRHDPWVVADHHSSSSIEALGRLLRELAEDDDDEDHMMLNGTDVEDHHDGEDEDEDHHDDEHEDEDHHEDEDGHDHKEEDEDDHEGEDGHDHEDEDGHDHEDEETEFSSALADDHDDDHDEDDKPWGEVIVASLIINIVTLMGVFVLTGEYLAKRVFHRDLDRSANYHTFVNNVIPSFACGALLATTVFLILPEAMALIGGGHGGDEHSDHDDHRFRLLAEEDHDSHDSHDGDHDHASESSSMFALENGEEEEEEHSEAEAIWRFGTCVICGFLLPVIIGAFLPRNLPGDGDNASTITPVSQEETENLKTVPDDDQQKDLAATKRISDPEDFEETGSVEASADAPAAETTTTTKKIDATDDDEAQARVGVFGKPRDYSLAATVLLGDFLHNFADGIFVGTAFLLCNRDLAITIAAATIYHELAQEISDYFLFTRYCGIPPCRALFLNFVSGLSVLLGGIIVLAIEDLSGLAVGSILAVSGGVYFFVAIGECYPRAKAAHSTPRARLVSLLAFVVGVVPIGLVLLNHEHCEAGHDH